MTEPINLKERFGDRYRVAWDGAYDPKHRPHDKRDSWAMEIPCRRGTIYPYCDKTLAVMVDHHPKVAATVGRIPGVELIQDGDDEKTFRFPVELFDQIAEVVRPHKRPRLTPEQRREAADRLRPFRFRPAEPTGLSEANASV